MVVGTCHGTITTAGIMVGKTITVGITIVGTTLMVAGVVALRVFRLGVVPQAVDIVVAAVVVDHVGVVTSQIKTEPKENPIKKFV